MQRKELLESSEYWTVEIQMQLFKLIQQYLIENKMSRKELADKLGFSKGYISQILNGNYDHKISKLVELSLAIGLVPRIEFVPLSKILIDDDKGLLNKSSNIISELKEKERRNDNEIMTTIKPAKQVKAEHKISNAKSINS